MMLAYKPYEMPGLVVFGRRWRIASDDLVFAGAFELFIRVIWWICILVLYLKKGLFMCTGGGLLHSYLIVLLILLAAIILTLSAVVYVSMQGSISNPGPRRSIPALIYVRTLLYVPELVWAVLGAVWVSNDSPGCDTSVVNAVIGAVVASWIILFFTVVAVLIVFDPLGSKRQGYLVSHGDRDLQSSQSAQLMYRARSLAARVWESRIKLLCCCIMQEKENRAAFSSIGQLFSDFFSDTDLVASDIAAGLSLLHQEQDKVEKSRDPEEVVVSPSPASHTRDDLDVELENAAHYMQFAVAAYGWPMFVFSNPLTGVCKLSRDCCRSRSPEYDIVGRDHLGCNFTSMLYTTGLQYRDFIYISFHNKIYEIPFFVALDHKKEAVLVAVRGTLSLQDALTDLSADCENLLIEGVCGPCYAHKGIMQAANYIYGKLINDGILNHVFTIAPEYKLVITGHSLGAGTAAVLSILLRSAFPGLKCYAFSPPGGLLSKPLADYSKEFIVSVVLGKDLVPRLSIPNMEDLKRSILRMVANCNKPKYQILLRCCWYEVFGGNPDDLPTELERRQQRSPSYHSLESEHPPLYLPGRILHIVEEDTTGRSCFSQVRYRAMWSSEALFCSVLISSKMITDHMPDHVLKALNSLTLDRK
ncbi:diacylglycerol lipase-beta-like isoform X1 [Acipenser ruthenus]|uniref:diacylglycerol lipase-beta-like isoform X1 n=2 Tax=Acipenser ruthenus TaxID=7906 RepID=UPI002740B954|nr:diacylglycerol lipase-beta-like isoform X1 [Acipenser ruthenus]